MDPYNMKKLEGTKNKEKNINKQKKLSTTKTAQNEPQHEISNNVVWAASKASDQPAHMRSLIRAFACRLNIL